MNLRYFLFIFIILHFAGQQVFAQKMSVERIDPPFWFTGMEDNSLQLLVKGSNIGSVEVKLNNSNLNLVSTYSPTNSDYLIIDLEIDKNAKPGSFEFQLKGKKLLSFSYELREKTNSLTSGGLSSEDLIYLIMPDRFSNGNPDNDIIKTYHENIIARDSSKGRHGGDIQGIINHLDYIQNLGATALWLNPVQENNQPFESYHGYAITDHYKIDERLGDNELYTTFVNECHKRNLKVIMDVVFNHPGNQHYLYQEMPDKDWFHLFDTFTRTTYRAPVLLDPYASDSDKQLFSEGWFDKHMPDFNQENFHLSKYLIQNALWWIETTGIDAFRIDTYAYSDQGFMSELASRIFKEYKNFFMFGETWVHGVPIQYYFTEGQKNGKSFDSHLHGVTDFQLYYAINEALTKEQGWTDGVSRIYYSLAQDYLYEHPENNVVFLDNHDLSRFWSMVGKDVNKFRTGIAFLFTTRGIPMLFYGTEILMDSYADPDSKVRIDFPGGWKDDKVNKFEESGRNSAEKEAFSFIRQLSEYRKSSSALKTGKLMQFVPEKGVYVYFRYDSTSTVMIVLNTSYKSTIVFPERFKEIIQSNSTGKDIISGSVFELGKGIPVEGMSPVILELHP